MIPKTLHYCWFGKQKKSPLINSCIKSWKKLLPDYKIVEWNESNSDLMHPYVKEAYRLKKWAFVSDFVRLKVLYQHGGIYLDTDMMMIKSLDKLLLNDCFFGAEQENLISAGIIACQKNHFFIKACLSYYDKINLEESTNFHEITIPLIITRTHNKHFGNILFKNTVQANNVVVYPVTYFYPFPNNKKNDLKNYKNYIEDGTYAVHLWNASWVEYDEFYYLRNRNYFKSLAKIVKTVFFTREFNLYYFKRIYYSFIKSL
ncbi:glycosyltransferase [Flavobacterium sp. TAB 87]|uniref:glycosyltransferase n=1 Tax=Flavobacterium sp. TAB 87 TaxID=1729581 RepID=UPI00076D334C|nr:glycosyltransferase [Flavobacterium sp. TAB 87]KVV15877.1 Mannosyltransferase OCH1 [Flavobacterium sp. TAB 87]